MPLIFLREGPEMKGGVAQIVAKSQDRIYKKSGR